MLANDRYFTVCHNDDSPADPGHRRRETTMRTTYRLVDDATGRDLTPRAQQPEDLFDADEAIADDEIMDAIASAARGAQHVAIGGGAAPLIWIVSETDPE